MAAQNKVASEVSDLPKDANTIIAILKDMGVSDYEPKVINQMLEFTYRYISDVLDDAKTYSNHAGRSSINLDDIKLSVQTQLDHSFTGPPPRDFLVDIARQKNTTSLPSLKNFSGARLPPDRYCLSSINYRLKQSVEKPASIRKPLLTKPVVMVDTSQQKHQFVNPQMIMPTAGNKRKWLDDDDDYDT